MYLSGDICHMSYVEFGSGHFFVINVKESVAVNIKYVCCLGFAAALYSVHIKSQKGLVAWRWGLATGSWLLVGSVISVTDD